MEKFMGGGELCGWGGVGWFSIRHPDRCDNRLSGPLQGGFYPERITNHPLIAAGDPVQWPI